MSRGALRFRASIASPAGPTILLVFVSPRLRASIASPAGRAIFLVFLSRLFRAFIVPPAVIIILRLIINIVIMFNIIINIIIITIIIINTSRQPRSKKSWKRTRESRGALQCWVGTMMKGSGFPNLRSMTAALKQVTQGPSPNIVVPQVTTIFLSSHVRDHTIIVMIITITTIINITMIISIIITIRGYMGMWYSEGIRKLVRTPSDPYSEAVGSGRSVGLVGRTDRSRGRVPSGRSLSQSVFVWVHAWLGWFMRRWVGCWVCVWAR